jgi:cytochrome c peroxidase
MTGKVFSRTALAIATVGVVCGVSVSDQAQAANLSALEELGKRVFFDPISRPAGKQSCSSCHDPSAGWTGPDSLINTTIVAVPGAAFHSSGGTAIGGLKPPSNAYASFSPPFSDLGGPPTGHFGGNFWDGRSEGRGHDQIYADTATEGIGDEVFLDNDGNLLDDLKTAYGKFLGPVAEQALNPFPNNVEQNIEIQQVCQHVEDSRYAGLYEQAWNEPIKCSEETVIGQNNGLQVITHFEKSFKRIAVALAAFQASKEVNSFTSKRDNALARDRDGMFPLDRLTDLENWGHDLFYATIGLPPFITPGPLPVGTPSVCEPEGVTVVEKGANCTVCHGGTPDGSADPDGTHPQQLYTDNAFHNIGIPHNAVIPFNPTSEGLASHTGNPDHIGEFKTPTLRNVDKRKNRRFIKAYGHNGWFKSLESIVRFYNTANVDGDTAAALGITRCPADVVTEVDALEQNCWPEPEHPATAAIGGFFPLVGDLGLNQCDEKAIVSYLKTLTDKKTVKPPKAFKVKRDRNDRRDRRDRRR